MLDLWSDSDHVEAFIGDVTVDGVTFTNTSLRYSISNQTWVLRNYANAFRSFATYDDGTTLYNLGGTTTANVVKMETGNMDIATGIDYLLETAWMTIGNNPAVEFTMSAFAAFVENASGAMDVQFKTDRDSTWRSIGSCKYYVNSWSGINVQFHRIKFRFTGTSSTDQVLLDGFSILSPMIEGMEKDSLKFNP